MANADLYSVKQDHSHNEIKLTYWHSITERLNNEKAVTNYCRELLLVAPHESPATIMTALNAIKPIDNVSRRIRRIADQVSLRDSASIARAYTSIARIIGEDFDSNHFDHILSKPQFDTVTDNADIIKRLKVQGYEITHKIIPYQIVIGHMISLLGMYDSSTNQKNNAIIDELWDSVSAVDYNITHNTPTLSIDNILVEISNLTSKLS